MGFLIPLTFLAGCDAYPRDVAGTLDRIERTRQIRVGLVSGLKPDLAAQARAFVGKLEQSTGARAVAATGEAEPLLAKLDDGQLDLVIGEVATNSPWLADAAVIEPLSSRRAGKATVGLSPIARNGENRWVMLLERTVRDQ